MLLSTCPMSLDSFLMSNTSLHKSTEKHAVSNKELSSSLHTHYIRYSNVLKRESPSSSMNPYSLSALYASDCNSKAMCRRYDSVTTNSFYCLIAKKSVVLS